MDQPSRPTFSDDVTRALLAAIVDSSDDVIVRRCSTVASRPGIARPSGCSAGRPTSGRPLDHADHPGRSPGGRRRRAARLRCGEQVDHFETVRITKDGRLMDVSLTVSPIETDGPLVGASKIARDITERKRADAGHDWSQRRDAVSAALADGALGEGARLLAELLRLVACRVPDMADWCSASFVRAGWQLRRGSASCASGAAQTCHAPVSRSRWLPTVSPWAP